MPERAPPASEDESLDGEDFDQRTHLERLERQLIERALETADGNRAHAARLLGIGRAFVYTRMKHFRFGE